MLRQSGLFVVVPEFIGEYIFSDADQGVRKHEGRVYRVALEEFIFQTDDPFRHHQGPRADRRGHQYGIARAVGEEPVPLGIDWVILRYLEALEADLAESVLPDVGQILSDVEGRVLDTGILVQHKVRRPAEGGEGHAPHLLQGIRKLRRIQRAALEKGAVLNDPESLRKRHVRDRRMCKGTVAQNFSPCRDGVGSALSAGPGKKRLLIRREQDAVCGHARLAARSGLNGGKRIAAGEDTGADPLQARRQADRLQRSAVVKDLVSDAEKSLRQFDALKSGALLEASGADLLQVFAEADAL